MNSTQVNPKKLKHHVGWSLIFKKNVKFDFIRPFNFFKYKVHTYMNKAFDMWGAA